MTCKDCVHCYVCRYNDGANEWCKNVTICEHFADKSKFIELPCIAMVERFIKHGKFDRQITAHNGRTAVVYMDKSKWHIPLIDITNEHYNTREANDRIEELKRSNKNDL